MEVRSLGFVLLDLVFERPDLVLLVFVTAILFVEGRDWILRKLERRRRRKEER